MSSYAVIGTSPFNDATVAIGPYRTASKALEASYDLDALGYNTEIVELVTAAEIGSVVNDEGE